MPSSSPSSSFSASSSSTRHVQQPSPASSTSSRQSENLTDDLNSENPVSFEAFRRAVLSQSPDQITQYMDEDGEEVDLESKYAGSDTSSESECSDMVNIDAESGQRPKVHPIHDASLLALLDETEKTLNQLSVQGRAMLEEQPQSTQVLLASQTAEVFEKYKRHGNQARLAEDIFDFLTAGDEIEAKQISKDSTGKTRIKKGTKARLRFAPVDPHKVKSTDGHQFLYHPDRKKRINTERSEAVRAVLETRREEKVVPPPAKPDRNLNSNGGYNLVPVEDVYHQALDTPLLNSQDSVEGRSMNPFKVLEHRPGADLLRNREYTEGKSSDNSPSEESEEQQGRSPAKARQYSVIKDAEANTITSHLPFQAVGLYIRWPNDVNVALRWPQAFCDSMNRIVLLHDTAGQILLNYFVRKYAATPPVSTGFRTTESSDDGGPEPPHALFRLAISQHLQAQLNEILQPPQGNHFGLNQEAQRLFDECSIFGPSGGKGKLNVVERELMSRIANVDPEVVDAWWKHRGTQTRAWTALRVWCIRRDAERVEIWKREGKW